MNHKFILICLAFFFQTFSSIAQQGDASAAMSMSKQKSALGVLPGPGEIVVEEYINYHRHQIAPPLPGDAVGLDLRWQWENSREGVLQVGITTQEMQYISQAPPVNVALVIDKSGSMSDDRKMEKTKEAMLAFVRRLRPQDVVSIVAFDDAASVIMPARSLANLPVVEQAIGNLSPGGSTNLYDGMLQGYREVLKNYDPNRANRLIILTDAMTNTGATDPAQIIAGAQGYNGDYKIDFAFIGVGIDFNSQLSRQLTSSQRNLIHFINDPEDIEKVFNYEVESLLAPVARNPVLEIEFDPAIKVEQVFGYAPLLTGNRIRLSLDNMNAGLTKVVLAKFSFHGSRVPSFNIRARLDYLDLSTNKNATVSENLGLSTSQILLIKDADIQKNFTIARMAQALSEMSILCAQHRYQDAAFVLAKALQTAQSGQGWGTDPDVERVKKILENYLGILNQRRGYAGE